MRCKLSVINVYCELITWLSIEYEWYFSYRCVLKRFQFSSFCYKDIIYESLSYEMLNVFLSKYICFQGYFNCFVSSVFTVEKDNGASLWSSILFVSAKNYKFIESANCFLVNSSIFLLTHFKFYPYRQEVQNAVSHTCLIKYILIKTLHSLHINMVFVYCIKVHVSSVK